KATSLVTRTINKSKTERDDCYCTKDKESNEHGNTKKNPSSEFGELVKKEQEIGHRVYYADEKPSPLKPALALETVVEEKTEETTTGARDESSQSPPETNDSSSEVTEPVEPPQPPLEESSPVEGPNTNEEASPPLQENATVGGEEPPDCISLATDSLYWYA
ncbi:predicted protein, partial [Arabidopsis lyrata subsp. lyrata]